MTLYYSHRFQGSSLTKALAMINAIEVMNKSPLLADANITLGYRIADSCSDVSTALKATAQFTQQDPTNCDRGSSTSTCGQPVMAVIGASYSETSIAIARQLTLNMIPQVSGEKQENAVDSVRKQVGVRGYTVDCYRELGQQNRFALAFF